MPITSAPGPQNGQALVQQELSRRIPQGPVRAALVGAPQTGSPIPVFHLDLVHLTAPSPLDLAYQTGWRYPVIGGLEPGLAYVRQSGAAPDLTSYGGLQQGLHPRRLMQAGQMAQVALAADQIRFEPRMLQVVSLQFSALWLHGSDDRNFFVSLLEGSPPGTTPLQIVNDIFTTLRARAAARPPAGGSLTPTN